MLRTARQALVAGLLATAIPQTSLAQESAPEEAPASAAGREPTAEELIAQGVALRKQGRDGEALASFERAYALRPSPRAVAQIALAHQALAQWREAERGLVEVLAQPDNAWVAANRAYLEASLAAIQGHLAWLEVESNVGGAELWVASQLVGRLPLDRPFRIESGDLSLEVRAPGFAPIRRSLHVEAGSNVHEAFTFAPLPAPLGAPDRPPAAAVPAAPDPAGKTRAELPARPAAGARTAGWAALAGAGGLLLVGVGGLVTREWEALIYNDDSQCAPAGGLSRYDRCGSHRDIGMAAQTVAIVAFVGSGIAAATSAVLLLGGSRPRAAQAAAGAACTVAVLGLTCGGRF